jgi:hypothetical protein
MRAADDVKPPSGPPLLGPLLVAVRRPENRILLVAATVIVLGGACVFLAVFAARGQVSSWLSVVGGTLFAAGTSVFLSVLAARQSAMEGYAKEANVEHKDKLYMPLYDELKTLADELKEARVTRAQPYPQVIDDGRRSTYDSHVGIFVTYGYTPLTLSLWSTIRTTRQVEYFSMEARRLLDATLEHAELYNDAAQEMRPPARELLARGLQAAIEDVENQQEYRDWYRDEKERYERQFSGQTWSASQLGSQPRPLDERHQLFAAIAYGRSFDIVGHQLHENWAGAWLDALPIQQPLTLGWVLAGRPDEGARVVYDGIIRNNQGASAPVYWIEGLLSAMGRELETGEAYKEFVSQAYGLMRSLDAAVQRLDEGMTAIRDRYEGGAPLV